MRGWGLGASTIAILASGIVLAQTPGLPPIPSGLPPTGAAGGDLAGTYPNPGIKASVALTTPNIGVATGTSLALGGCSIGTGAICATGTGNISGALTIGALTAGRVPYAGTAGLLSDDSGLTYNSATHALTTTTFIGALTGNASTATAATTLSTTLSTANSTFYLVFVPANSSSNQAANVSTAVSYNPNAQALTSTSFVGTLTGHSTLDLALTGGVLSGALTSNSVVSGSELRISNNTVSRVAYNDGGGGFTSGYNIFYNAGPVAVQNGMAAGVYYGTGGSTTFYNDSAATGGSALTATMTFFNNNTIVIAAPPGASAGDTPICQSTSHVIHTAAAACGTSRFVDKKNILDLHEYLEQQAGVSCSDYLTRMQAVRFDWKFDGSPDIGFIADWTGEINPLLATYVDGKVTNVRDRAILALTLCSLQEEQVARQLLEARLAVIEAGR